MTNCIPEVREPINKMSVLRETDECTHSETTNIYMLSENGKTVRSVNCSTDLRGTEPTLYRDPSYISRISRELDSNTIASMVSNTCFM